MTNFIESLLRCSTKSWSAQTRDRGALRAKPGLLSTSRGNQTALRSEDTSSSFEHFRLFSLSPWASTTPLMQAVGNRGYTGLGEQTLDPGKQKKGDTKESYYICSKSSLPFATLCDLMDDSE
jgi:hypothetical protein